MKIISCYVENFGTLSKFALEFSDGLNMIQQENGWGKTTLAAFIKAMLFGLEYTRAAENERKKYMPWNGGKYGGNLCFEVQGNQYRIERSFGKTDKNDTFMLYDMETNLKSTAYGENLGEELFGVDRESFEKSIFISLSNHNSLLTDIMSAKMAETPYDNSDMDRLQDVLAVLDKKAARIKPKRGNGGLLGEADARLSQLLEEIKECDKAIGAIALECDKKKEYEKQKQQEEALLTRIGRTIASYGSVQKKEEYAHLKNELEESRFQLHSQASFFGGKVPTDEEIAAVEQCINDYNAQAVISKENNLSPEDRENYERLNTMFEEGVLSDEVLDSVQQDIFMLQGTKVKAEQSITDTDDIVRLEHLKERFGDGIVTDGTIDRMIDKYEGLGRQEAALDAAKHKLAAAVAEGKRVRDRQRTTLFAMIIASGSIVIIGLLVLMFVQPFLGIGLEIGGMTMIAVGCALGKPTKKRSEADDRITRLKQQTDELKGRIEKDRLECSNFVRTYGRGEEDKGILKAMGDIRSDLHMYKELTDRLTAMNEEHSEALADAEEIRVRLDAVLGRYLKGSELADYTEAYSYLKTSLDTYHSLGKVVEIHNHATRRALAYQQQIRDFTGQYFDVPGSLLEQVRIIFKGCDDYSRLLAEVDKRQKRLERFIEENDGAKLDRMEVPKESLEELNDMHNRATEKSAELARLIAGCDHRIDEQSVVADQKEDLEAEACACREERQALQKQYEILQKTAEVLKISGDALSKRYMSDIERAFRKYANLLRGDMGNYHIDMKLEVHLDKEGGFHDKKSFSSGEKDLTELCVRLALLDAVYKDSEQPVIILDDPFVNFDNERLKNAMGLVESLARQYQVIYCVCHESRSM